jgi:hypothetical protein
MCVEFIEARENAAILLDLVDEIFDHVPFTIQIPIVSPPHSTIPPRHDDWICVLNINLVAIVSPVSPLSPAGDTPFPKFSHFSRVQNRASKTQKSER